MGVYVYVFLDILKVKGPVGKRVYELLDVRVEIKMKRVWKLNDKTTKYVVTTATTKCHPGLNFEFVLL